MSTYIVAFVIGEFDYLEAIDADNVVIRVYTPPTKSHLGAHALRMARSALPFYKGVFGTGYPLPKLDLVALPDFAMGAMENWGLLTYRYAPFNSHVGNPGVVVIWMLACGFGDLD